MKNEPAFFTQLDVSQGSQDRPAPAISDDQQGQAHLLRQLLAAQDRQNELLEEMLNQLQAAQRQRSGELVQWKQANPELATSCRRAAESLSKVQAEFLNSLTDEVNENVEHLMDGEFMLNEFVDRFGPRLAHLNGVLQVLTQLGSTPDANKAS